MMIVFHTKIIFFVIVLIFKINGFKINQKNADHKTAIINTDLVNIESFQNLPPSSESPLFNEGPGTVDESQTKRQHDVRKKTKVKSFQFKATGTPRNRKIGKLLYPHADPMYSNEYDETIYSSSTSSRYLTGRTPQYAFNMYNPAYKRTLTASPSLYSEDIIKSKRQYDVNGNFARLTTKDASSKYFHDKGLVSNTEITQNDSKSSKEKLELSSIPLEGRTKYVKRVPEPDFETVISNLKTQAPDQVMEKNRNDLFLSYYDIDYEDIRLIATSSDNISAVVTTISSTHKPGWVSPYNKKETKMKDLNKTHLTEIIKKILKSSTPVNISDDAKPVYERNRPTMTCINGVALPEITRQNQSDTEKSIKLIVNTTEPSIYRELLMKNILRQRKESISKKIKALLEKIKKRARAVTIEETTSKLSVFNETLETSSPSRPKHPYSEPTRWNTRPNWNLHSFMGLYIHEPSNLYCDAAGISPHWLVASGICLNRHVKEQITDTRSAYVVYCGPNWKTPGRVAYVKYSLQHPRFQPSDPTRSHLYNIGLIRVGNAMDKACGDWKPVELMSYHFTTDKSGLTAQAIGWGLDRYSTKFALTNLPNWPLLMYEGTIFSESCPGNSEYQDLKHLDGVTSNMYCMTLPSYLGEDRDPVHGSFLFFGGKLIALYLKEERKSWGDQSAVYTGVWKVLPWIMNVALEPEDPDLGMMEV